MLDPFPIGPPAPLVKLIQPVANALSLPTLPLHFHEVLFALSLYTIIGNVLSPILSTWLFPDKYPNLNKRTRINWNVHVVSFFQSLIICTLSFYLIFADEERKAWKADWHSEGLDGAPAGWEMRIWGYTGMTGLVQSFALGYFLWDFYMCSVYVHIFGWGMLAHAISACTVFSLGFRPFLYFYAPVFLLYELSSPFLNIHWFCDKLDLTGSSIQALNGAFLTGTFFCCRSVWGAYASFNVFSDMYKAVSSGHTHATSFGAEKLGRVGDGVVEDAIGQQAAFMGGQVLPLWLASAYIASNLMLNLLNYWWFGKMVETIRKRFDPPWGTKGIGPAHVHYQPQENEKPLPATPGQGKALPKTPAGKGSVRKARERAEEAMNGDSTTVQRGVYADGHKSVEVTGTRSVRSRRKA